MQLTSLAATCSEPWLCWTIQPPRQPQEALPQHRDDPSGPRTHRPGHALFARFPHGRDPRLEGCAPLQLVHGAAVLSAALRLWPSSSQGRPRQCRSPQACQSERNAWAERIGDHRRCRARAHHSLGQGDDCPEARRRRRPVTVRPARRRLPGSDVPTSRPRRTGPLYRGRVCRPTPRRRSGVARQGHPALPDPEHPARNHDGRFRRDGQVDRLADPPRRD